ncbi:glucose-6-phosphate dehydrogenase assembly protein OpcA [Salinibacterium sp. NSLL150]|uniref:glucose-6-phosphate dehydrogenase assembly protein OpcA n=1 Tax=unclassified Salinibacterium TaxID=2632331 RepID=UPI0018CEBAE7|nr:MULTISPECIES: glucose-6-phosphate dehydrogenase assembly protein OpcA [unclassified Salinibacterium]MBH0024153.1 glucose-6-phosphate dehydrogenase assembly protein OpcA [Salinibacterium sp. SWN248]MBH0099118.1 glucose-6-phosphate dehydrogenase assembly protein OpcA [Salinibacterium sp. NSLL35]MBH0101872.1 glucose-6-phosphate dehydrogenase assembly protein OpcA [Salinibacterium sp. NSLL150]MBH0104632.1 glucose-6-phosphate dehydrogenase assembly protein OpcA [Salinibacterium sp. NSLL16]MBH010
MIVDLPNTTTAKISKALVRIREDGGAVALGRVLTLIIATEFGNEEEAIEAANDASREHPMRVLVVSTSSASSARDDDARVDAQIRVGGDAGASEVIVVTAHGDAALDQESLVTGLLLPDAPVVAWWPGEGPASASQSPIGRIAQRRITDAAASTNPLDAMHRMCKTYVPGDTDFAWTRLTLWRAQLAAVLDQPPYEAITAVTVSGAADSASTMLLAAWLQMQLKVKVTLHVAEGSPVPTGIHAVILERASGTITLERNMANIATLTQPDQPVHDISLPRRSLRDCLAEELRRLDPDSLFGDVVRHGVSEITGVQINNSTKAKSE